MRAGDYATVNIQGHVGLMTPDDLARKVTGYLAATGSFDVSKNSVLPARDILSDLLAGNVLSWDYIANVTIKALVDADDDTAVSTVRAAFSDVAGYEPTGAFLRGLSDKGAPSPDTPELGFFAGIRQTLGVDALLGGINDDVRLVLYGVLALVIIVAALIAFGPNVPKLLPTVTL